MPPALPAPRPRRGGAGGLWCDGTAPARQRLAPPRQETLRAGSWAQPRFIFRRAPRTAAGQRGAASGASAPPPGHPPTAAPLPSPHSPPGAGRYGAAVTDPRCPLRTPTAGSGSGRPLASRRPPAAAPQRREGSEAGPGAAQPPSAAQLSPHGAPPAGPAAQKRGAAGGERRGQQTTAAL